MSTILEDLLKTYPTKTKLDDKIKEVCDKIMAEEREKFLNPASEPIGANIILSIEVACTKIFTTYLCLEREFKEKYIISLWKGDTSPSYSASLRRIKVWEVKEYEPNKIFKMFAEILNHLRGV